MDEYKGSTFSISNLGMFGVETFNPIINQPDAGILGVCAVQDELVMDDAGAITKRQFMRISFTFDHRLIDGATAAKFELAIPGSDGASHADSAVTSEEKGDRNQEKEPEQTGGIDYGSRG